MDAADILEYILWLKNNTDNFRIEQNGDNIDIYCTPRKPIEYIALNFIAVNNNVSFSEVPSSKG